MPPSVNPNVSKDRTFVQTHLSHPFRPPAESLGNLPGGVRQYRALTRAKDLTLCPLPDDGAPLGNMIRRDLDPARATFSALRCAVTPRTTDLRPEESSMEN